VQFQKKVARLQRAVSGALQAADQLRTRLAAIKRAIHETPALDPKLMEDANAIEKELNEFLLVVRGDTVLRSRNYNTPPSISERVSDIVGEQRMSLARPSKTHQDQYAIAAEEFAQQLPKLRTLVEVNLARLEKALEAAGAPWTPGRIPEWRER
jgi:hypothetical protein